MAGVGEVGGGSAPGTTGRRVSGDGRDLSPCVAVPSQEKVNHVGGNGPVFD